MLTTKTFKGCSVTCFPFDYPLEKVAHHFDGIFISNGPGDPTHCVDTVHTREDYLVLLLFCFLGFWGDRLGSGYI